jgi:hypothetical protein
MDMYVSVQAVIRLHVYAQHGHMSLFCALARTLWGQLTQNHIVYTK